MRIFVIVKLSEIYGSEVNMIKQIIMGFLTLILIIAGLVGFQWFMFNKGVQQSERIQKTNLEMDAGLVHKKGQLEVTQKVSSLEQDSFLVAVPAGAQSIECTLPNKKKCNFTGESSLQRIDVGNESVVTFKYTLPIDEHKKNIWIEQGFVQFFTDNHQKLKANVRVTITEGVDKSITWLSGAISEAVVNKEYLSYFAWTNNDATAFPLYMTKESLRKVDVYEPNLSLFIATGVEAGSFSSFKNWYEQLPKKNGLTIVQSETNEVYLAPLLVVVPKNLSIQKVEELAVQAYLLHYKKPITEDIKWTWDVLPSFVLNHSVGQGKALEMSNDLIETLQPETRKKFANWLLMENSSAMEISLDDLDKQLSDFSTFKTLYFNVNKERSKTAVPFYYIDSRKVLYGDHEINVDWNAVIRNNAIYFPFSKTMEGLQFEIKLSPDAHSYSIAKEGENWTFYVNEAKYIHNQQKYATVNPPLEQIGDDIFISEASIEELLKVEVIKREQGIYLRK